MTPEEVLARHTNERGRCSGHSRSGTRVTWPCDAVQMARQLAQSADALRAAEERAEAFVSVRQFIDLHLRATGKTEIEGAKVLDLLDAALTPDSTGAKGERLSVAAGLDTSDPGSHLLTTADSAAPSIAAPDSTGAR